MTGRHRETIYITIQTAGRRTGLSPHVVRECTARKLVIEPLTEADLVELRRIRRLQELGVNPQGIEISLHMRQRIQALQMELARLQRLSGSCGWSDQGLQWPIVPPPHSERG
jgi:DNA-binding transcriptional MerR regulator